MNFFQSDNNSGVHPNILEGINNANEGIAAPYGNDDITKKAIEKISEVFGQDVDVYFVSTGTAANIIGLAGLLKPFEAVVCTDTGHINVEECGALQVFSGARILYTPNSSGKITKEDIKPFLSSIGNEHESQPKVIYISQTTEEGTIYTVEEIKELADFAHENNMYLHVDGARIANAV